ncbi:MAG TPA: hypothetical protein VGF82_29955 [Terracidiphilus sp.]
MNRIAVFAVAAFLACTTGQAQTALPQTEHPSAGSVTLPAGTRIEVAVVNPVWSKSAKPGDPLYTQVDFPVLAGKSIAIPAGTYVRGTIQSITRPSRFKGRAEIQALFTTLIFANNYAAQLTDTSAGAASLSPTLMKLNISVSFSSDLLLDNGAQFNIMLASPLTLDAMQVAAAIASSRRVDLGQFRTATLCRPTPGTSGTPGTPGTPDTVIPGSPGTPPTVIPGGPGQPDTVIPGTPATPDTVIPGSPGIPGTPGFPGQSCPAAPMVVTSELVPAPPNPAPATKP